MSDVIPAGKQKVIKKISRPITPEEETRILGFLFEGRNAYQIGKIVGRDRGCVMRVAERHKKELSAEVQKRLTWRDKNVDDGYTQYSRYVTSEKRQEVLSFAIDKIQRMLQRDSLPAKDVRDLCVSLGITVDKFAVETGKTDEQVKAALIGMFKQMQVNVNNGVVNNGNAVPSRKAGRIYSDSTEED
jgi:hypothetical protein